MAVPMTVAQAAERLDVSERRVRFLCEQERLKATKVGRDWLIDQRSVERFKPLPPGRPPKDEG